MANSYSQKVLFTISGHNISYEFKRSIIDSSTDEEATILINNVDIDNEITWSAGAGYRIYDLIIQYLLSNISYMDKYINNSDLRSWIRMSEWRSQRPELNAQNCYPYFMTIIEPLIEIAKAKNELDVRTEEG